MCPSRPPSVSYFNNHFLVLRFRAGVLPVTGTGGCIERHQAKAHDCRPDGVIRRSVVPDNGQDQSGATERCGTDCQSQSSFTSRVLKLDTHNDIEPANFTADCNYTMRLTTQVNLPKMVEGGMDVSFMIAYVGQGPLTPEGFDDAYRQAVAKFDAVHRLTEKIAPDNIGLALTPADVLALHKKNLRIAVIGVENGYPIGTDLKRVKEFYDRGGRYMSLAHNGNSQLADSNTGETQGYLYNNGLSPLGREVIAEMNRLGMMVDLSHPSKGANMEAMRLSKAPVIASHSGVRALANVSRNMDDEQLLALKKNGGVIQVVGFASYVKTDSKERIDALAKLREEFGIAPQAADVAAPVVVDAAGGRRRRCGGFGPDMSGRELPAALRRRVAEHVAADEAGEMRLSRLFHPNGARNTTSGWPRLTRSCRLRAGPT